MKAIFLSILAASLTKAYHKINIFDISDIDYGITEADCNAILEDDRYKLLENEENESPDNHTSINKIR